MNNTYAALFPGQGSQSIGMMAELYAASEIVRETISEATPFLDFDLWKLMQEGPENKLNNTLFTQPAMLVAGVAAWRFFGSKSSILPTIMAGHSLGEYTALVCSGALNFNDAIDLVNCRAQYMHNALTNRSGAMAAIIGLKDEDIIEACEEVIGLGVVEAVNFNAPGQVVIAGDITAVERAIDIAKKKGARRAMLLNVSIPSHCELMKPASVQLNQKLKSVNFNQFNIPVINNVDVDLYSDSNSIVDGLTRQVFSPVRWADTIRYFVSKDIRVSVEFGPGGILSGLCRRIDKSIHIIKLDSVASIDKFNELVLKNPSSLEE